MEKPNLTSEQWTVARSNVWRKGPYQIERLGDMEYRVTMWLEPTGYELIDDALTLHGATRVVAMHEEMLKPPVFTPIGEVPSMPPLQSEVNHGLKLHALVTAFRDKHEITCAEAVYQRDAIMEDATEFIESLLNVVGYFEHDDD